MHIVCEHHLYLVGNHLDLEGQGLGYLNLDLDEKYSVPLCHLSLDILAEKNRSRDVWW